MKPLMWTISIWREHKYKPLSIKIQIQKIEKQSETESLRPLLDLPPIVETHRGESLGQRQREDAI